MNFQYNAITYGIVFLLFTSTGFAQNKQWTLEACINQALKANIQVQQAELGNMQAALNYQQIKASRMPSAQAVVNQNFGWNKSYNMSKETFESFESAANTNVTFNSNFTIYSGLKIKNQIKQSELDLLSFQQNVAVVKEAIALNVLDAFLQVLYGYEAMRNAKNQMDATQEQLKLAKERLELNVISQSDFMQIKSALASEKSTWVNAKASLLMAKVNLMQLMELPVDTSFQIASPGLDNLFLVEEIPEVNTVYKQALHAKPQVKKAAYNEASALLNEPIAKADLYPSLMASAGFTAGYNGAIGNYSYAETYTNQIAPSVGFTLTIPVYQKKQVKTNMALAQITTNEAKLNTREVKNNLRKNVEQALANVISAQEQYLASNELINVSRESMKLAEEKFKLGLINAVDYLFERTNLTVAESELLQNKYQLIFNYKVVDFYQGKALTL